MELSDLSVLLFSTLGSTSFLVGIAYFFKDIIFKYYEKKINIKFEKEMEEFRQKIREKDSHIALINNYLTDLEKNRSKVRNDKQLIAAEDCLKLIKVFNKTNFLIQILIRINFKKVYAEKRELELQGVGEQLYRDCNIENILKEIKDLNSDFIDLYLDRQSLNSLRIFQGITVTAITLIAAFKDKTTEFLKKEDKELVELIIKYLPSTKSSFEKYGDEYMFIWHDYFYEKTLISLRSFVSGEKINDDIVNIQKITMTTRKIYNNLPDDLKVQRS